VKWPSNLWSLSSRHRSEYLNRHNQQNERKPRSFSWLHMFKCTSQVSRGKKKTPPNIDGVKEILVMSCKVISYSIRVIWGINWGSWSLYALLEHVLRNWGIMKRSFERYQQVLVQYVLELDRWKIVDNCENCHRQE